MKRIVRYLLLFAAATLIFSYPQTPAAGTIGINVPSLQKEITAGSYVNSTTTGATTQFDYGGYFGTLNYSDFFNDTIVSRSATAYNLSCAQGQVGYSHKLYYNYTINFSSVIPVPDYYFELGFPYANNSNLLKAHANYTLAGSDYNFSNRELPMEEAVFANISFSGYPSGTFTYVAVEVDAANGIILNMSVNSINRFTGGVVDYNNYTTSITATNIDMLPAGNGHQPLTLLETAAVLAAATAVIVIAFAVTRRRRRL